MITFLIALAVLICGYIVYGSFVERVFGANAERSTPAYTHADGVDFVPLPTWRVFLIQFLNIAGLGPIFGAIMGIMYGPAAYLWIVLGTLFGGAVHDYLSGMLSIRSGGASLPELVGEQLGRPIKQTMRGFALVLMILVGAVFVVNPANLINMLTADGLSRLMSTSTEAVRDNMLIVWILIILTYYVLATLLPVDKLIGRIYPFMGFALLFMAVGIMVGLFFHAGDLPEMFAGAGLSNRQPNPSTHPIFPMMFVSIACGAISGFHATQSPLMARCIKNERLGRRVFYGAMVAEGAVALIWAAAAIAYMGGSYENLTAYFATRGNSSATFVNELSRNWLGTFGGILAIVGVVAAPITSGDTALRSARLIAADFLHIEQNSIRRRLMVSIPIFALSAVIMMLDYNVLWRYFGWCNQTLSVFTLWAITVYLARHSKLYAIALLPALFMTMVCCTYICVAPEGFGLPTGVGYAVGATISAICLGLFVKFAASIKTKSCISA